MEIYGLALGLQPHNRKYIGCPTAIISFALAVPGRDVGPLCIQQEI